MHVIKQHIGGILIGICIAVTAFHVWFVWQLVGRVNANTKDINTIAQFIQQATQQK